MISIDKLKNVKRLVTHANCPDGIASALIVKDALPDVEVLFVKHGTEQHRTLEPRPGDLFCDFSPHIPEKEKLLDGHALATWVGAGVIVLDHHPTQRNITDNFAFNGLGVFGENVNGECGAWLAFAHVWRPLREFDDAGKPRFAETNAVQEFAELAGVRDTWKKDDPRWRQACEQAEALTFWGFDELKKSGLANLTALDGLGRHLFDKKLESARNAISESHVFTTPKGTGVLMFQGVYPTSDAAELLALAFSKHVNIVAGFHYRVDAGRLQLQFSTRSHTGYDVGAFCKSLGGGGHTAAAGFTVEQSAEVGANPYAVFRLMLQEWESGQ